MASGLWRMSAPLAWLLPIGMPSPCSAADSHGAADRVEGSTVVPPAVGVRGRVASSRPFGEQSARQHEGEFRVVGGLPGQRVPYGAGGYFAQPGRIPAV